MFFFGVDAVLPPATSVSGVPGIYLVLDLNSRAILTTIYTEWVSRLGSGVQPRDLCLGGNSCLVSGHLSASGLRLLLVLSLEPLYTEDRFYPLGCHEANHGIVPLRVSFDVKML